MLGVFALAHLLAPIVAKAVPDSIRGPTYQLVFFKRDEEERIEEIHNHRDHFIPEEIFNFAFDKKGANVMSPFMRWLMIYKCSLSDSSGPRRWLLV